MSFDIDIWHAASGSNYVKFKGQHHSSKFSVTWGNTLLK